LRLAELAARLPPTHDLETLTVWLALAREGSIPVGEDREFIDVVCADGPVLRFNVPRVELIAETLADVPTDAV
jgi:hypothetical protein